MIGVLERNFDGYGHGITFRNTVVEPSTSFGYVTVNTEEYADISETTAGLPSGVNVDSIQGPPQILGIPTTYGAGFTFAAHNNITYLYGGLSEPIGINNEMNAFRLNMRPPSNAPTLTAGAGTTEQTGYISFYDEVTDEYSPLSAGDDVTGSLVRSWAALPTAQAEENVQLANGTTMDIVSGVASIASSPSDAETIFKMFRVGTSLEFDAAPGRLFTVCSIIGSYIYLDDPTYSAAAVTVTASYGYQRATHVVLWVSVNSTLPREAGRVRIGQTTFSESTPTFNLGQAQLEPYEAMPVGNICAFWNDRLIIAGTMDPARVYLSDLFYPERYVGLNFPTKNGEVVTGIYPTREYCYITTTSSIQILQGYTENDMTLSVADNALGNAGPHTACFVKGRLIFTNAEGVFMYDGASKCLITPRKQEWTTYVAPLIRDLQVTHDPEQQIIRFRTPISSAIDSGKDANDVVVDLSAITNNDALPMYCHPWGRLGAILESESTDGTKSGIYTQLGMETWTDFWVAHYAVSDLSGWSELPEWTNDRFDSSCTAKDCYDTSFLGMQGRYYYIAKDFDELGLYARHRLCYYSYLKGTTLTTANPKITSTWVWLPTHEGDEMSGKVLNELTIYSVHERQNLIVSVASGDEYCAIPYWMDDDTNYDYVSSTFDRKTYVLPATFQNSITETAGTPASRVSYAFAPQVCTSVGIPVTKEGRGFVVSLTGVHDLFFRFIGFKMLLGPGRAGRFPAAKHTFVEPA